MYSIGNKAEKMLTEALDYIETNLNHQYAIPNYASGYAVMVHHGIEDFISALKCEIEIKNLAHIVPEKDYDYGDAMADMAILLAEDELENDIDFGGNFSYDPVKKEPLPPIKMFKIDWTYSGSRTIKINEQPFKITVTFERKYTHKDSGN